MAFTMTGLVNLKLKIYDDKKFQIKYYFFYKMLVRKECYSICESDVIK